MVEGVRIVTARGDEGIGCRLVADSTFALKGRRRLLLLKPLEIVCSRRQVDGVLRRHIDVVVVVSSWKRVAVVSSRKRVAVVSS